MGHNRSINWKGHPLWFVIHLVALLIVFAVIPLLPISNNIIYFLSIGLGVTLITRIVSLYMYHKSITLDLWFIFWVLVYSLTVWVSLIISDYFSVSTLIIILLITSACLGLISTFVKRLHINHQVRLITSILLIACMFILNDRSSDFYSNPILHLDFSNPFGGSFSFDSCPQLENLGNLNQVTSDVSLVLVPNDNLKVNTAVYQQNFLSWTLNSYDTNTLKCHLGSKVSENKNNYYCGTLELPATYMIYNELDQNGAITEIIKRTFVNEYNAQGVFVKTRCGQTYDQIVESIRTEKKQQEQEAQNQLEDFVNMFK